MSFTRKANINEFLHPIFGQVCSFYTFVNQDVRVGGTAVIIAPQIALTASHVLKYLLQYYPEYQKQNLDLEKNLTLNLYVSQFQTGATWYVSHVSSWIGTDIAVLSLMPRNDVAQKFKQTRFPLTVNSPNIGSTVTAIGFHNTDLSIPSNNEDILHLKFNINPTISQGTVIDVHRSFRDPVLVRFPSFSVDTDFQSGMSGGAVFDERRRLCGLICTGGDGSLSGYSTAASIWPAAIIPVKMPNEMPEYEGITPGFTYKLLDLAKLGYLNLDGHERIEFFKHENGSNGVRRHNSDNQSG